MKLLPTDLNEEYKTQYLKIREKQSSVKEEKKIKSEED